MITLPTSDETRQKLKAKGWTFGAGDTYELFYKDNVSLYLYKSGAVEAIMQSHVASNAMDIDAMSILEACAILGIAPPGFVMVPVEVAREWLQATAAIEPYVAPPPALSVRHSEATQALFNALKEE